MRYTEQLNLSEIQKTGELEEAKKLEARLQLIDTTLLKCYIKVSNCHVVLCTISLSLFINVFGNFLHYFCELPNYL